MTPFDFGRQIGTYTTKRAFFTLPAAALGAGLGAVTSPEGHRTEGAYRGAAKGSGTAVGGLLGMPLGVLAAAALMKGKNLRPTARMMAQRPMRRDMNARNIQGLSRLFAAVGLGVPVGGVAGGTAGYAATSAGLGKPSWEQKTSAAPAPAPVAADPGARTKAMINGMRQQGISSGQWADNGAAGFSPTNITYSAAAKAKAQPTTPVTPAAQPTPAAPAPITTRTKSRSAF